MEKVPLSVEQQVPSNEGRARDRDEIKATLRNANSPMHVACLKKTHIAPIESMKCIKMYACSQCAFSLLSTVRAVGRKIYWHCPVETNPAL